MQCVADASILRFRISGHFFIVPTNTFYNFVRVFFHWFFEISDVSAQWNSAMNAMN